MQKAMTKPKADANKIAQISTLTAPLDDNALSTAADGDLLIEAAALHAEALMHAEERLYEQYAKAARAADGRRVILSAPAPVERGGHTGIRALLHRPDLLDAYLAAALRASRFTPVALMLPFVCAASEITDARCRIEAVMRGLAVRKQPFDELTELYISIATPAAVLQSRQLADGADLLILELDRLISLTVGARPDTWDYALLLSQGRDPLLRLIEAAVGNAHLAGRRAAIQGDPAHWKALLPDLIAMGVDALILPPSKPFISSAASRSMR